jgi:hypothetical protein
MFVQDPMPYLDMKARYRVVLPIENNNLQIKMVYKLRPMYQSFLMFLSYHLFLKSLNYHPYHLFLKNHLYHHYR